MTRLRLAIAALAIAVASLLFPRDREEGHLGVETSGTTTTTTRPERAAGSSSTTTPTTSSETTTTVSVTTTSVAATTAPTEATTTSAPAPPPPPPATSAPPPPPPPSFGAVSVRLTEVARLNQAIAAAVRPGDPGLWLADKGGTVHVLRDGALSGSVFQVPVSTGGERGLLGIAFSPHGQWFIASYTDPGGNSVVSRHAVGADGLIAAGGEVILFADQPFANHNGGHVVFGPDGHLYLGLGDGGSAGDPGNRAQDPGTVLGKLIRFASASPPGNPEIVASGLRNPWRFSFDRGTGDLWLADVGQNAVEEVNWRPFGSVPGTNFGWSRYEGTRVYRDDRAAPDAVFPIYEYGHDRGCSVTGGYVYRGGRVAGLGGAYLYGDFCEGEVRALLPNGGGGDAAERPLGIAVNDLASFAEDAVGELYVLSLRGPVYRIDPS